ncbi:MAG: DUF4350 domain-containing protein [Flavisolibacter sp.]
MKKSLPYIITVGLLIVVAILIFANRKPLVRTFNERITLKQKDKIPYGTAVARTLLPSLFPSSSVSFDNKSPGNWDSINVTSYNQAVILVAMDFDADDEELERLGSFVKQGNYIFIIARSFSAEASRFFNFSYNEHAFDEFMGMQQDSLRVKLEQPVFETEKIFVYPGKRYAGSFYALDIARTVVLGRNEGQVPDFVELKSSNGRVFIHTAPLAFSNYFILHKNNVEYFRNALSVIPSKVERIVWNEYYLNKPQRNGESEPNIFRVLMRYPAFKWGLLTGMFMLALYVLLGSRRTQRKIPGYERPRNDSLDFVKTVGRLYYDRRDHHNLARKMSVYFLEHVRSVYKLPTQELNENFVQALHVKSGFPKEALSTIVSFIQYLDAESVITEQELTSFHSQLEMFYQNT